MNIVIIEDERLVATELAESLCELETSIKIVAQLHSVREAVSYFKCKPAPDLIFSDVQLGDGLSFDIFLSVSVSAPIIFCTAYDNYALEAFRVNGIDYILKPFDKEMLASAIEKFKNFRRTFAGDLSTQYKSLLQHLTTSKTQTASSILVHFQDKIIPLKLEDIALFYLRYEETHLQTFDGKTYHPNKNLEELEKVTGELFFRANRQYLVNRKAINDVSNFFSRKLALNLNIPFPDRVTVSKEKAPVFLDWLSRVN
ncbi:LytR/AlgR family response regulator transcription factor [Desertivirga xinjiangensis]|uniref:LytR/AlgR family response regulator transcription factor n=1 Tax=Desertivirga xinjiangensis TaxID=539206 RepID=UPI00210AFC8E|nr:LytTR family DNA-binding domain-containing protein [Pedobacter xinjiangensis]